MPKIIDPGYLGEANIEIEREEYRYPFNLDLRPGSELHQEIVGKLVGMAQDSQTVMQNRWSTWEDTERVLSAYALMDEEEYAEKQEDVRRPVSVVVPMTYATLETLLTVWMNTLGVNPMFKYIGAGPEDRVKAMLLEMAIDMQCSRARVLGNLHTQWRDALAFGLGVTAISWEREYGRRMKLQPQVVTSPISGQPIQTGMSATVEREIVFEGNVLQNISPYNYLPDPNVAAQDFQKGEFCGFLDVTNIKNLLSAEQFQPDVYFNVEYLKGDSGKSPLNFHSPLVETRIGDNLVRETKPIDRLVMYVNLIPKDWKLGKSRYPEKWVFEVAGGGILIRCQPTNLNHGRYPITVCCPTFDGYSVCPISSLDVVQGLQEWIDWCFRSHITNVRKALHNTFLVDPYIVNYDSFVNMKAGGVATIREHMWGRGVQNAVEQLQVHDVTSGHMGNIGQTIDLIQRVTGAVDSLQGIVRPSGERRSATEMRDTRSSAVGRIQKQIRMASMQSMYDTGYMFASHFQQFMSKPLYLQMIGENQQELMRIYGEGAMFDPQEFIFEYDMLVSDGSGNSGEYLPDLIQLFQMSRGIPETANAFDPVRQMMDLYVRSGIKGSSRFLRLNQMQVMPDQMALAQMAAARGAMPVSAADIAAMQQGPQSQQEISSGQAPRPE